jgi:hypothetical protein
MTLTEFLLARIAEDEAAVLDWTEDHATVGAWWIQRILRDCAAKRQIIRRIDLSEWEWDVAHSPSTAGAASTLDELLRLLAVAYDDHPDYREEWRP